MSTGRRHVGWQTLPEPALLTIDMQADFARPTGSAYVAGTDAVINAVDALARDMRQAGRPIVHMVRLYAADGSDAEPVRAPAIARGLSVVRPGTVGSQTCLRIPGAPDLDVDLLHRGVPQQVGEQEWFVYKPRWGAFYRTPLHDLLHVVGAGSVVISGCNWPNCPRTTLYEASERDLPTAIATDAISGLYPRGVREAVGIGAQLVRTAAPTQA